MLPAARRALAEKYSFGGRGTQYLNSERAITAPRPRPSSPLGHTTGHEYTATAKNETSQPTGRRKAGFEVWVPIKGGLDL